MLELVMKAHESIMQGTDRVLSLEHVSSRTVLLQKVPNLHVQCSLLIRSIGIAHTIPEASKTGVTRHQPPTYEHGSRHNIQVVALCLAKHYWFAERLELGSTTLFPRTDAPIHRRLPSVHHYTPIHRLPRTPPYTNTLILYTECRSFRVWVWFRVCLGFV